MRLEPQPEDAGGQRKESHHIESRVIPSVEPTGLRQEPLSWSSEKGQMVHEREGNFDFNAKLRDSNVYKTQNRDAVGDQAKASSPEAGLRETIDRLPESKNYDDKGADRPLAAADKKFDSIDAALDKRGKERDETVLPGKAPDSLSNRLKDLPGYSKENLELAREEIRTNNLDPVKVVPTLMKEVRVLGLGETHMSGNPQREFGSKMMPELARNGATHLAVEIDSSKQPILDEFMRTGKLDITQLPALLQDAEYVKMLNAARSAGMKIVAVDDHSDSSRRDEAMAANIGRVLDQNPQNKVVFWVGSAHLERISDPAVNPDAKSASQILEQKYKTATVAPNIGRIDGSTLPDVTADLARPSLLPIARMPVTAGLRSSSLDIPKSWYRDYDFVILYPEKGR